VKTKRATQKVSKTKSLFFEKINKIERPVVKLTKRKREKIQISKIEMRKGMSQ
jgi:hypothetical protein